MKPVDPAVFDARLARPELVLPKRGALIAQRYRLGEDIGEGGMSLVYSARDERLGREVALKVLNPRMAFSREVVTRFVNEARTLAQLDCPHVVRVFDAGVTEEPGQPTLPFMVLELLRGTELRHVVMDPGPEDVRAVVGWMLQICDGLAAAHVEGIIHRDLKPENLFLVKEPDGTQIAKVLDFGIARSMHVTPSVTLQGERMGSPGYMSPEQIRDVSTVDERSDIWSLGVIMYELLAGVAPFKADSALELCVEILNASVAPLQAVRPDLPAGLSAVVQRCMQRPVDARFANMAELAEALAPYAHQPAAELAARVRRRLSIRQLAFGEADTSLSLSPPVVARKRLRVRGARGRFLRPLALGAVVGLLSFVAITLLPGAKDRGRELVTTAGTRFAAAAQGILGHK